jgi:hypothetical protein
MANLARDYHKNLQNEGLSHTANQKEHKNKTLAFLRHIPREQKVQEPETSPLNWTIRKDLVREAILAAKNGSATGMDGCPYELWKKLTNKHEE